MSDLPTPRDQRIEDLEARVASLEEAAQITVVLMNKVADAMEQQNEITRLQNQLLGVGT